ncbi:MAG TPA: hypothetical protein VLG46_14305 [Anaerolineae bacterium]|nr:hypothetical protein [Anaerolineae bacterium]
MFDSTADFNPYLAPGERVVWQGQGRRRMNSMALSGWIVMGVFLAIILIFLALAVAMPISSRSRGDAPVLIILPIIFLIVGLSVGLPLVLLGQRSNNTLYAVTTNSVIIVYPGTTGWGKRVAVLPVKGLQQIVLSENRDGTGTLTFGMYPMTVNMRYSGGWWLDSLPAFWNIDRPMEVYQLIRQQMAER